MNHLEALDNNARKLVAEVSRFISPIEKLDLRAGPGSDYLIRGR